MEEFVETTDPETLDMVVKKTKHFPVFLIGISVIQVIHETLILKKGKSLNSNDFCIGHPLLFVRCKPEINISN